MQLLVLSWQVGADSALGGLGCCSSTATGHLGGAGRWAAARSQLCSAESPLLYFVSLFVSTAGPACAWRHVHMGVYNSIHGVGAGLWEDLIHHLCVVHQLYFLMVPSTKQVC